MAQHNPYHFIPVKGGERVDDISRNALGKPGHLHITHDRYVLDKNFGRVLCRIITERPIVLGGRQRKEVSGLTTVEPFELEGRPALPATSIKGLISSTLEAATDSALRVLENRKYSYRKTLLDNEHFLSAIGMIVADKGRLRLRPLTLPLLETADGNTASLPNKYQGMFEFPNLRVYIGDAESIRDSLFAHRTYCADKPEYFGLPLDPIVWATHAPGQKSLKITPNIYKKVKYILGQIPVNLAKPVPWLTIPENERDQYKRGILRVLGCWGRDDIPATKQHEVFIPFPDDAERWPTFEIPDDVLTRFYDLADERTDDRKDLPYEPRDTVRNHNPVRPDDSTFRLKHGDLVYFAPNSHGTKVGEIALSSIWRGRVETINNNVSTAATTFHFFEKISDEGKEILPFNQVRKKITIAEQIFGFVENFIGEKQTNESSATALKGRVRFSAAKLESVDGKDYSGWKQPGPEPPYLPPATLKILSSPKPPCPALYFKQGEGKPRYLRKPQLKPGQHRPQGRKLYLHHRVGDGEVPWRTEKPEERQEQKAQVTPVKKGAEFWFHLDFDNLSDRELNLLCYSLRPTPEFRHKLGMGKAIGLGTIRIDPVAIFEVNRGKRYSEAGLYAPRYDRAVFEKGEMPETWPVRYVSEVKEMESGGERGPSARALMVRSSLDPDIRNALELIGNPNKLRARVSTPLVQHGESEDETFLWFVANDLGSGKGDDKIEPAKSFLEPLHQNTSELPTLENHEWRDL
jgi:CRISPR-associated protein (TIGR03986 family)